MSLLWLLVILVVVFAVIGMPQVGVWNHGGGYYPSGIGLIVVVLLVIFLLRGGL